MRLSKMRGSFFLGSLLTVLFAGFLLHTFPPLVRADTDEDLARYVWKKTQAQLLTGQVAATGQVVSGTFRARYIRYDKDRNVIQRDSAEGEIFGKDGILDSIRVTSGAAKILEQRSFSCPDLGKPSYRASFFPNDTGGTTLALNIDMDSSAAFGSVGIVNVDRATYLPSSFYLSLPVDDDTRRRSQIIKVVSLEGGLYPVSFFEVVVEKGILSQENYQLSMQIDSLRLIK